MVEENHEPVDDLAKSYEEVLGPEPWETDVADARLLADSSPPAPLPDRSRSEPALSEPPPVLRIIEALLFVGGTPLTEARAGEVLRGLTPEQFSEAVDSLNQTYRRQDRPYTIQAQGQGYVLTLRPRWKSVTEKLYGGVREARLSTTAIDVLSLVAYRQPATKAEIDSLRGAESGALLRQLVRRGLITVVYRADADRKEVSYGTTPRFLEFFGLQSLDDLPRTQDLQL